jgi:LTXXQ motif family protein
MFSSAQKTTRLLAAAALVWSILLACSFGNAADNSGDQAAAARLSFAPQTLAQTSTAPATTESAPAREKTDPVEARIKELHRRLHITSAQQAQWDKLVQVMRDNAKAMNDLQEQRKQDAKSMTAVTAVKSYQAVIEAHEAGMAKFVPAFESLYDSMSDAQKKAADAMFRSKVRVAAAKKTAKEK